MQISSPNSHTALEWITSHLPGRDEKFVSQLETHYQLASRVNVQSLTRIGVYKTPGITSSSAMSLAIKANSSTYSSNSFWQSSENKTFESPTHI